GSANGTSVRDARLGRNEPAGSGDLTARITESRIRPGERVTVQRDDVILLGTALLIVGQERPRAAADPDLVVADPKMRELFELVERIAPSGLTVLLLGESGVGKR